MTQPPRPQPWLFNPPPGWPPMPPGWLPPRGWTSPTSWPAPPAGWIWYLPPLPSAQRRRSTALIIGGSAGAGVLLLVIALIAAPATPTPSPTEAPQARAAHTSTPRPSPTGAESLIAGAGEGTALATLGQLAIKGRAPTTGYSRELFGQAWADVDRNGCDTRNDVLRRDLTTTTLKADTNGCLVLSGLLADPYTGENLSFSRGDTTLPPVEIDHVVALSDAWQKGAQQWTLPQRTAFANDPLNLLAVDGSANASKGAGDAATWLPGKKTFRCPYVARQVAVKFKYHAWVTAPERAAIADVLADCPGQPLPTSTAIPLGGGTVQAAPSPTPSPQALAAPPPPPPAPPAAYDFANCTDMHGTYPHGVGRPGARDRTSGTPVTTFHVSASLYEANSESDRDGDGVACEKA